MQKKYIDTGPEAEKLDAFKRTLRERHTVDIFLSPEDLVEKLRRDLRRHLTSSSDPQSTDSTTELNLATEVVQKFLLVPKKHAGREVRLKIQVTGQPYPASQEVCEAFNYELGSTVGLHVKITEPTDVGASLTELYFDDKQIEGFLPVTAGESREIYAKLLFSAKPIERVRARYSDASYYTGMTRDIIGLIGDFRGERVNLPADSKVALAFSKPSNSES